MQKTIRIIAIALLLSVGCANSVSAFSVGATPTCFPCSSTPPK